MAAEGNDSSEKKSLLKIKGHRVTQADYRGLLSLILLVMFGYALFSNNELAEVVLGPFMGVILGYYFHDKATLKRSLEET